MMQAILYSRHKVLYSDPLSPRASSCLFRVLGPVSRNYRKVLGPEEPFLKLRPAYSVKLVFSYVVMGIKIKITAKFRASRRLRFEDAKRIMSPVMRPKSLGTFEKQVPGYSLNKNVTLRRLHKKAVTQESRYVSALGNPRFFMRALKQNTKGGKTLRGRLDNRQT